MVSSLSPHNLHLLSYCALSVLALISLVLMALFYAAIRRDYVSLLNFPFLSHGQVFSCEICLLVVKNRPQSWFFFQCSFPIYCQSVLHRVVSIIFDGCNQSSFVFFCVIIESLCRCVNAVFNDSKSSFSILS